MKGSDSRTCNGPETEVRFCQFELYVAGHAGKYKTGMKIFCTETE